MPYRPSVIVDHQRTYEDNNTLDRCTGYRMDVRVALKFWANQAQFSDAYKNAEKQVLHFIYGDVIVTIGEVHSMLYAGDLDAAHKRLAKLEQELLEPSNARKEHRG